jgi:ribosome-associated heat shock protein Hsp15
MTGKDETHPTETQRLDKWLWFARVCKSRTSAAELVQHGKVRVNRSRATKPSHTLRPGDVLTVAVRGHVQVLKVVAPGVRRGPPPEARQLYELLSPAATRAPTQNVAPALRAPGTGRPTKRERRLTDELNEPD